MSDMWKSTIGRQALNTLSCLWSSCWYQNRHSVKEPLKAGFAFIAFCVRRLWAYSKKFSWTNWVYETGMMHAFANVSTYLFSWERTQAYLFIFVIIIFETNLVSVKWTVENSKTNIKIVANHLKKWCCT